MYTVSESAQVGLIMGSDSDWPTMEAAAEALAEFGIRFEVGVVSAHRTPQRMLDYAKEASGRGIKVIIAGAGGAAHLPGMVASATPLPVIGVPVPLKYPRRYGFAALDRADAGRRPGGDGLDRWCSQRRSVGCSDPRRFGPCTSAAGWWPSRRASSRWSSTKDKALPRETAGLILSCVHDAGCR